MLLHHCAAKTLKLGNAKSGTNYCHKGLINNRIYVKVKCNFDYWTDRQRFDLTDSNWTNVKHNCKCRIFR